MASIQDLMDKAKIELMATPDSAFYMTICFSLIHKWNDKIRTACTDGKYLMFSPKFFMECTPEERVGVLVHECCHVAYVHPARVGDRDRERFNVAADHVINLQLLARGFKLPKFRLADPKYAGMSTEEVYDLLEPEEYKGADLDISPLEGDPQDIEQQQKDIEDIVVQAAIQSAMAGDRPGTIPGDIQIFLDRLLKPKLPWPRIFQKYLTAITKNDYTFKKPNRRFFPKHFMPSLFSQKMLNIAIAVDASGSVRDHEFLRSISEIHGIFRMMKPDKIDLIQFDTEIKSVTTIKSIKDLSQTTFIGRGGTNVAPVLQWANENKPHLLVIFTDGHFRKYETTTDVPVIWMIDKNPEFTYDIGKVIHYTSEN